MELSMKKRVAYKKESAFCAIGLAFLVLNVIAPLAHGWELVLPQWQDSSERKAGTRQTIKIGEDNYGFVWIPAGEFDMGSPESEVLRLSGEKQIHVKLTRGFWALETEVTQALYQEVTGRNPSYNNNPALPVECVTYNDVVSFCEELTKRLPAGLTADIPTEAEWEYACRAGSKTTYNWGDKSDPNRANVGESKKGGLTPPASYPANAWGLYDMHGNVSEWVKDWRAESYVGEYGSETVVDPKGPKEGVDRVTRGGSWGVYALVCRSAYRYWRVPEDSENDLGARIVLRPQSAESPTGISHVIFIGVDGGGTFFRDADTPNLDKIFADGAVTYSCLCENPTISAENWGAMLHGVKREIHGLTNGLAYSTPYPDDSPYPSVFRVIRENMPGAKLASICSWNPINLGVIENGIGVFKDKVPDDDAGVTEKVCEYLEKNQPTLLYVHYNEVDGAGHGQGFGGKEHLAKLHATDGYIQKIYEAAKKNGMLDSTLFIVTADHGGHGTMHGGWTDEEKYVMFAATGPGLEKGEIGEMENRDMAAVVLYALGLGDKQPETWTSRVPSGLFKGVEAKERPVVSAK
jgi:formylglycine-generating enzyme required for sulfatase activity